MLLGKFLISGHSMIPFLIPGQRVLISSIPYLFSNPKAHDVVAFKYRNKTLVKRISKIEDNEVYIQGDNTKDSLSIGKIDKKDIIGKFIIRI